MGSFYRVGEPQNSGTGPNMHFSSYLTPCYFIPSAGRPWPVRDVTLMSGNGYSALVQPSSFNHYVIYEKETIRQNMLNHQAAFTCQVHELHRLYERQKELMAEHRMRVTAAHQLQYQRSQSDRLEFSSQNSVPPWESLNAEGCVPSLLNERYIQRPPYSGDSLQSENNSFLTKRSLADNEGPPPQIKKYGKRMIDLELPADMYIHNDEEDDSICENIGHVPLSICSLAKETPEFHLENVPPYPLDTTGPLNIDSSCRGTKLCIDLNEPIQLEDEPYCSSNLKSTSCSTQNVHLSPVPSPKPVNYSKASNEENVINVMSPEGNPLEHQPPNSEAGSEEVNSVQNSSAKGISLGSNISCESHDSSKPFGSSCISCSQQIVPHSADSDFNALSSVTSQRSPNDLRELPLVVQALPCFKTAKMTKGPKSAYASSRDKYMVKKTTTNDADNGKVSFRVYRRLSKRLKYSHDTELLEHVDLNCMHLDFETLPLHDCQEVCKAHHSSDLTMSSSFDNQPFLPFPMSCKLVPSMSDGNEVGGNNRSCDAVLVKNDQENLAKGTNLKQLSCSNNLSSHLDEIKPPTTSSLSATVELLNTKGHNTEGPVILENSQCHSPRGESEDTFDTKEDELIVGELDQVAAEAICSISVSLETMTPESSRPLDNCLNWFAGIASSVGEDLCDEMKEPGIKAADSSDQILGSFHTTNLDTRKARVRRTKDAFCRGKIHNEQGATDGCSLRLQGRDGKSRKPKILKEKSLKTIGMRRRTDVVTFDGIKRRKRNTGNRFAKRRPCITTTHFNDLESSRYSSPICNAKAKNVENHLQGWGSRAGRRKARRVRRVFDVFFQDLFH